MTHTGTVPLETDRLILRRFAPEDAAAMYANWASSEEVTRFLTWPAHPNAETTRALLDEWTAQYGRDDYYNWVIELKETGEIVGNISVVRVTENTASAELGYCMGPDWWGQGIMPEAGKAVIAHLFCKAGFNRVAAVHAAGNPKSGRAMQKMGMRCEGTLRQAGFCNQGIVDTVWYSILADEFGPPSTASCVDQVKSDTKQAPDPATPLQN